MSAHTRRFYSGRKEWIKGDLLFSIRPGELKRGVDTTRTAGSEISDLQRRWEISSCSGVWRSSEHARTTLSPHPRHSRLYIPETALLARMLRCKWRFFESVDRRDRAIGCSRLRSGPLACHPAQQPTPRATAAASYDKRCGRGNIARECWKRRWQHRPATAGPRHRLAGMSARTLPLIARATAGYFRGEGRARRW